MRATTLRVVEQGVVLFSRHRERLSVEGKPALEAFDQFSKVALPGIYSLVADGGNLVSKKLPGSRLYEGMPMRVRVSPVAGQAGLQPKLPSPCVYDSVREQRVVTLLMSPDENEYWEACVAAVIGWDGARFVFPPLDRPRVGSTLEAQIKSSLPFCEAPILALDDQAIAVGNAVAGICQIEVPGRKSFPSEAILWVQQMLRTSACRA